MAGPTQDSRYVLVAMSRRRPAALPTLPQSLPPAFAAWFAARGWRPRPHQIDVLEAARAGSHVLLIAPTGGGKTLSSFLPSLIAPRGTPRPSRGCAAAWCPHPLSQPAQGARDRYRPQPDGPGDRDGSAHPCRDTHRRYAAEPPPAPAGNAARYPAYDARKPLVAALLGRRPHDVPRPPQYHPRRGACAGGH